MEIINPTDPLTILEADHEKTQTMLAEYLEFDFPGKQQQMQKISEDLAIHMAMEENIFYPEVEQIRFKGKEVIAEAKKEHQKARQLLKEISDVVSEVELDAKVLLLREALEHHTDEEERVIFSLAKEYLGDKFLEMATKMTLFKVENKGANLLGKIISAVV